MGCPIEDIRLPWCCHLGEGRVIGSDRLDFADVRSALGELGSPTGMLHQERSRWWCVAEGTPSNRLEPMRELCERFCETRSARGLREVCEMACQENFISTQAPL